MDTRSVIRVGITVRTLDGKSLGKVKRINSDTFEVERGIFFKRDLSLSYSEVRSVDRDEAIVDLSSSDLRPFH
jgi:hypothetical protein